MAAGSTILWTRLGGAALLAAVTVVGGCAGGEPIVLSETAGAPGFAALAAVLAAAVDERGAVDPTALAVQLPHLERQLVALARPWPPAARQAGSDARLAWLYNARAAWSLRIVARDRTVDAVFGDMVHLPERIAPRRLMETPFSMDGRQWTLAAIDRELLTYDDARIAPSAPGATDWAGALPRTPFDAATVRAALGPRFDAYLADQRRVVVDHADQRLRVPPALRAVAERIIAAYEMRYDTEDAMLVTALLPYAQGGAKRRLISAMGYDAARRADGPGIVTTGK
ncbi:MAG: hypothetical protein ACOC8F_05515 [Planctomycetota bacterium]